MNEPEIRLDRYVAAVWRAKWFILLAVIAAAAILAFIGLRQPTLYTASALIEVGRVWKEPLEDSYTTAELANGAGFLSEIAKKLEVNAGRLKRSVQAITETGGPRRSQYPILVRITATTENQEEATRFAQVVADEILVRHEKLFGEALAPHQTRQTQLEQRLADIGWQSSAELRNLAATLEAELHEVRANNQSPTITRKTYLADLVAAGAPIQPSPWRRVLIAALIAGLLATALAIGFDLFKALQPTLAAKSN